MLLNDNVAKKIKAIKSKEKSKYLSKTQVQEKRRIFSFEETRRKSVELVNSIMNPLKVEEETQSKNLITPRAALQLFPSV